MKMVTLIKFKRGKGVEKWNKIVYKDNLCEISVLFYLCQNLKQTKIASETHYKTVKNFMGNGIKWIYIFLL